MKKWVLAKLLGHQHVVEIGSINSELRSGPKPSTVTMATKRQAGSGHRGTTTCFRASGGPCLLPCIDDRRY